MKITLTEILAEAATFAAMTPEERDFAIESLNEEDRMANTKKTYKYPDLIRMVQKTIEAVSRCDEYPRKYPSIEAEYLSLAIETLEVAERHLSAAQRHGSHRSGV